MTKKEIYIITIPGIGYTKLVESFLLSNKMPMIACSVFSILRCFNNSMIYKYKTCYFWPNIYHSNTIVAISIKNFKNKEKN